MKDERTMDADRAERLRTYLQENNKETPNALLDENIDSLSSVLDRTAISELGATASAISGTSKSSVQSKLQSDIDQLLKNDYNVLFGMADLDNGEGDPSCGNVSFEELFGKFAEMKENASLLPPDQRKAYAEKVTTAFWRAIGGDDSEIAGLHESSDDDNDGNIN